MTELQKMLIVNDSPLFRAHLKSFLKSRYDVDVVELNTARGLNTYIKNYGTAKVALAIIDKDLPDGNGLEVIHSVKAMDNATFPFIVIGAIYDRNFVLEALKLGAVDIVGKPVQLETLLAKIDNILIDKKKQDPQDHKSIHNYYREIRVEIKRALRGRYHLTVFLVGLVWTGAEDLSELEKEQHSKGFLTTLQNNFRETDAVYFLSLTDYLLLLPFTSGDGVRAVEAKIAGLLQNAVYKNSENFSLAAAFFTTPEDTFTSDCSSAINNEAIRNIIATLEMDFKNSLNLIMTS